MTPRLSPDIHLREVEIPEAIHKSVHQETLLRLIITTLNPFFAQTVVEGKVSLVKVLGCCNTAGRREIKQVKSRYKANINLDLIRVARKYNL